MTQYDDSRPKCEDEVGCVAGSDDSAPEVGAWFVSQAAKDTYAEVNRRWHLLLAWGVGDKLPHRRNALEFWRQFASRWDDGDEELEALSTVANELNSVEQEAREKGYGAPAEKVRAPDVEDLSAVHKAAAWASRQAKEAEKFGIPLPTANAPAEIKEKIQATAASARDAVTKLPIAVQAGGVIVAGGAVVYGLDRLGKRIRRAFKRNR